jgi:hypothetical protein
MPYDFPRRKPVANAAVDGDLLTEDFAQAAERLSRLQGVHVASKTTETERAPVSVYFPTAGSSEAVPVGFGVFSGGHPGGPPTTRLLVPAAATIIPNDYDWAVIEDVTLTTTGTAILQLDAMLQYVWTGFIKGDATRGHSFANQDEVMVLGGTSYYRQSRDPSVKFAIRVDGEIVFATGPGRAYRRPPAGLKPSSSYQGSGNEEKLAPGIVADAVNTIKGPGRAADGIHLSCQKFVASGSHTIELVAKRIPRSRGQALVVDDCIAVYNRQLLAMAMHLKLTPSRSVTGVSTEVLSEGAVMSQNKLKAGSLDNLKTAANSVDASRIEPATLRHFQVRSALVPSTSGAIGAGQAQLDVSGSSPFVRTITNWMYDETDTTPATTTLTNGDLHIVSDHSNVQMQCKPTSGDFTTSAGNNAPNGLIKVWGRLQLKSIIQAELEANEYTHFAQVGIAYKPSSGSLTVIPESIVTVSRTSSPYYTDDGEGVGGLVNGWPDVPLFAYLSYRNSQATDNIDYFVIVVGVASNSALTVEIKYERAILNAVHFRK